MYEIFTETRKRRCLMRISMIYSLILIGGFQLLFASNSRGQNLEEIIVTIKPADKNLEHLLKDIELQTHLTFAYLPSDVRKYSNIGLQPGKQSVKTALDKALVGTELRYRYVENSIIIFPRQGIDIRKTPVLTPGERSNDISMSSSSRTAGREVVQALSITTPLKIFERRLVRNISGRVVDSGGEPLIGVNIQVKGSSKGTATDFDGNFTLEDIDENAVLVISYIGYQTQEISIAGKSNLNIVMISDSQLLDEVVVVGYGTQIRRNVTGAVTKVDMDQIKDLPNTGIAQALRGRVAGVQFTDNGRPGQSGSIMIRGVKSLSGSNAPLIILDGIIFNAGIQNINPTDIESIEVLKDANAAAIYGSRAANGVILITSKRGLERKPQIQINAFTGISDRAHKVKLLTPDRYMERMRDYNIQAGLPAETISDYLYQSEIDNMEAGQVNDHWNMVSQNAPIHSIDVSISGRTDATNYFMSGSYTDEKGLMLNDQMKRLTIRSNIENQITNWLSVGMNSIFITRNESGRLPTAASNIHPYSTLFYEDGEPRQYMLPEDQVSQSNPLYNALMTDNENIINNIFSNFYVLIDFPTISGLEYRFNYAPNYRWDHDYNFFRQDLHSESNTTSGSKFHREDFDWVLENIISYRRRFGENHQFDLTGMFGLDGKKRTTTRAEATQFASDLLGFNNLNLGSLFTTTSDASVQRGISSMGRFNYGYKDRYLFTFTMRMDGSSVFAERNKFAFFPSGAISWIASDEEFFKNDLFNLLKFRLSYGAGGNQAIEPYQSLSSASISRYVFGDGGTSSIGIYPNRMANDRLKWEVTYSSNFGMDIEFLGGRIGSSIELYQMNTKDLLVTRSIPIMTGFSSIWTNLGETSNRGVEVTINSIQKDGVDFKWSSYLVFSYNRNEIKHLYYADADGDGVEDDDVSNKWFIGYPVNVAYDYMMDGIYQIGEEFPTGYKAGDVRVKDINGDGVITAADRTILGQTGQPKFRWGIGNTIIYKNFSLDFFVNCMQSWIGGMDLAGNSLQNDRNFNRIDYGWWTEENQSNDMPSLIYTNPLGHSYYASRNFVRLQDLSLSYEIPKSIRNILKFDVARVFISGKNLVTITKWPGADPESGANQNGIPLRKMLTAGINISF